MEHLSGDLGIARGNGQWGSRRAVLGSRIPIRPRDERQPGADADPGPPFACDLGGLAGMLTGMLALEQP